MKFFKNFIKYSPLIQVRQRCQQPEKPRHLICFKQWTAQMVMDIINSAINLKTICADTRLKRLDILTNTKVMILQEVNEPILNMAVSKAATFLGAYDVNITDNVVWEKDYFGKYEFYQPEEYGMMSGVNVAYIGAPHPVLNSYLLLCPMLGANIRFKCCCKEVGVSPLLLKASEDMTVNSHTETKECKSMQEALKNACVIISGPTSDKKEHAKRDFKISLKDIEKNTSCQWSFFHTCPRGCECDDDVFNHCNARTFKSFQNMQYIAAALLTNAVKGLKF